MKILAGIPSINPDERFLRDTQRLFENFQDIEVSWVRGVRLEDAQNILAQQFLASTHEALLFLEEDHWGHTPEMIQDLIDAGSDVAAIGYYSRWPLYPLTLMRKEPRRKAPYDYLEVINKEPIEDIDLCGFGMTLIRRRVFEKLDEPFFRLNNINKRNVATDRNFCERVKELGLTIKGIFNHNLAHAGIDKKNVVSKRMAFNKSFWRRRG